MHLTDKKVVVNLRFMPSLNSFESDVMLALISFYHQDCDCTFDKFSLIFGAPFKAALVLELVTELVL